MIEGLRRKQVKLQIQREEEILVKIKQKMDRIKANQQKFQPITADIHRQGSYLSFKFLFVFRLCLSLMLTTTKDIRGSLRFLLCLSDIIARIRLLYFSFQYFCCSAKVFDFFFVY